MRLQAWLALTLLLALALVLGLPGRGAGPRLRSVASYRVERLPAELPEPWWELLQARLAEGPVVALEDPGAAERIRTWLLAVPWIRPDSLQVLPALPDGFQVRFRPRRPRLAVLRDGRRVAVLAADGTVLPPGVPEHYLALMAGVQVEPEVRVPPVGRRVADPLLQEALRCAEEFYRVREHTGLPLVAMRRREGYPVEAASVPPPITFVLEDGRHIQWGRNAGWQDPVLPGLTLERKVARLARILQVYPELRGVYRLTLDRARVQAWDDRARPLPLPEDLE